MNFQYDRARIELDYRRDGGRGTFKAEIDFATQDDPLMLAIVERMRKQAEEEAVRYYATHVSALGDF